MNTAPPAMTPDPALDNECINTLRFLSVDAVQKADSGHPGMPMGAASMAYVLWTRFLKHNPVNPDWFDRDRFMLSFGHRSALLYSLLQLTGYDLPFEQIKRFREWGSMPPGHSERGVTPGVETTTGPLGQGFGNGVGLAMTEGVMPWAADHFINEKSLIERRTVMRAKGTDREQFAAATGKEHWLVAKVPEQHGTICEG